MRAFNNKLNIDGILFRMKVSTPQQVFQQLALCAGTHAAIDPVLILDELERQEAITASATGNGVAIPQARLTALPRPLVLMATLAQPVDFDACDHKPVDLVAAVFSPHADGPAHLQRLSLMARILRDETLLDNIRGADDKDTLYALLSGTALYNLAA